MKSHYEVLNLEKNCSAKDIKDSFIKLSKKYHPDKNKSLEAHKKFVEVNEAYSVLGKNGSRVKYDESLSHSFGCPETAYNRSPGQSPRKPYATVYPNQYKQNYDKKSWNAFPKHKAFLYCFLLMAVGTGLRVMLIYRDVKRNQNKSREISLLLKDIEERTRHLGREQAILEFQKTLLEQKGKAKKQSDV